LRPRHALKNQEEDLSREKKCPARKNQNRAGATPLFGLSAAQKFLGSLPPWTPFPAPTIFFSGSEEFRKSKLKGGNVMSIIKKAPAIVTREFRLEQPVSLLLDDYALFIESSADHVLNSAIKKTLWRDQDYRKWREQEKSTDNGVARRGPEATTKS
jgi:hypothetical protein